MGKYRKSLEYLYNHLPIFQKIGHLAYKEDLGTTLNLMKIHQHPEQKFKSILIAGTNGKGSVSTMIADVLRKNNYKVGLYTSPHFKDFRERIRINGSKVSKSFVSEFVLNNKNSWEELRPSFFEISVVMAFSYFASEKVDIAVVEVGMGGRLDSTNVLLPELSIITRIGLDHQQYLGDTIAEIAMEKAGIIKKNQNVIVGPNRKEAIESIHLKSKQKSAQIHFANAFEGRLLDEIPAYQRENIGTVLKAFEVMFEMGWEIKRKKILNTCQKTLTKGKLKGRWQKLGESPLIIADAAHNVDGMRVCRDQLKRIAYTKIHVVFGSVNDKDSKPILELLPKDARFYFCKANVPRGKETKDLLNIANEIGIKGEQYDSVKRAFEHAKRNAQQQDLILITGSIYVIAEVI